MFTLASVGSRVEHWRCLLFTGINSQGPGASVTPIPPELRFLLARSTVPGLAPPNLTLLDASA